MADQGANINLRLALERAALQEAKKEVSNLTSQLIDARKQLQGTGEAGDKVIAELTTDLDKAVNKVAQLEEAFKKTTDEAKRLSGATSGGFNFQVAGRSLAGLGLGDIGNSLQMVDDAKDIFSEVGSAAQGMSAAVTTGTVALGGMTVALTPLLAALIPVTAVVGGLTVAIKLMDAAAQAAAAEATAYHEQAIAEIEARAQARKEAESKTTEQNVQDAEDVVDTIADLETHLTDLQAKLADNAKAYADLGASFNPSERKRLSDEARALEAAIFDTQQKIAELAGGQPGGLAYLTETLQPMIEETEKATVAIDAEKKAQEERNQAAQQTIDLAKQEAQLKATGTSKGLETTLTELAAERQAIQDALSKGGLSEEKIAQLNARLSELNAWELRIKDAILPVVKAREDEEKALKDTEEALKRRAKQDEELARAYESNRDAVDKIISGGVEARKQIEVDYQADLTKIDEDGVLARANIAQDYGDKLIDIARTAAQAATDALTGLEQKYKDNELTLQRAGADIDLKAGQDRLKLQIDAQREEAQSLTDHLRNLEDIRKASQVDDTKNLLDRNFLGLLKSRLGTNQRIEEENTRYARERQDAKTANDQRLQDLQSSIQQERNARLLAFNRANEDAKRNYERQLDQQRVGEQRQIESARIARDSALTEQQRGEQRQIELARRAHAQAIADLNSKIRQELAVQRAAYQQQIRLTLQTEQEKLKIIQLYADAARQALQGETGRQAPRRYGGVQDLPRAASGGFWMNDAYPGQRETFGGVSMPGGLGIFYPAKSGHVGTGGGNQYHFNIRAHDTEGVRREIVSILNQVLP